MWLLWGLLMWAMIWYFLPWFFALPITILMVVGGMAIED